MTQKTTISKKKLIMNKYNDAGVVTIKTNNTKKTTSEIKTCRGMREDV